MMSRSIEEQLDTMTPHEVLASERGLVLQTRAILYASTI